MLENGQMTDFAETFDQIISGTKYDRNKLIYFAERGDQYD